MLQVDAVRSKIADAVTANLLEQELVAAELQLLHNSIEKLGSLPASVR